MLRFLRKYQMPILVVGGSLLMISFLIGSTLQPLISSFLQPVAGTYQVPNSDKVRKAMSRDMQLAAFEADVIANFDLNRSLGLDRENDGEHWFLLVQEAERLGLLGYESDAEAWLRQVALTNIAPQVHALVIRERYAEQFGEQIPPEQLSGFIQRILSNPVSRHRAISDPGHQLAFRQLMAEQGPELQDRMWEIRRVEYAESHRVPLKRLDQIFAKAAAVNRMQRLYSRAPVLSAPRTALMAQDLYERAEYESLKVNADVVQAEIPLPTEEQLQAFFTQYQDADPTDLENNRYGLTYRLPSRIQAEWLTLDRDVIERSITIDRIDALRKWRETHPNAEDSLEDETELKTFDAMRPLIEIGLKEERAETIMQAADQLIRAAIRVSLANVETAGDYYDLPENWSETRPDLHAIAASVAEAIAEQHGVTIPPPRVESITDGFMTREQLRRVPAFITSRFTVGSNRTIEAAALAELIRELNPDNHTLAAQLNVPRIPPARSNDGKQYLYFQVTSFRESGPALSIEEVRSRISNDWQRIQAFELLESQADSLRAVAESEGLDAVAGQFTLPAGISPELMGLTPSSDTTRQLDTLTATGSNKELLNTILEAAQTLDPIASETQTPITFTVPLPESRQLAIARVQRRIPVTLENSRATDLAWQQSLPQVERAELETLTFRPFTFDALRERWSYKSSEEDEDGIALFDAPATIN